MTALVGVVPSLENIRMADDLDFGHVAGSVDVRLARMVARLKADTNQTATEATEDQPRTSVPGRTSRHRKEQALRG